ncbi:MAG: amino-acid N-acetyltransferase [Treponema sp.]|nr:amino-acid N-acetyltransferase [Treponema sp.]
MDKKLCSQVDLIREVFHYQSRFESSTMVFKIDYPVTEDPAFPGLMKDLALLAKTGFKVIIVPGAKENIDAVFNQHNIETSYTSTCDGEVRVTTSQAISYVEMAAFNVASRFMTFLSGSRVNALIGNFVRARGLGVINGIDTEHTGTVDKIYADSLKKVLDLGMIPILPCIGWSPSGKPYNVPSDEIALQVSSALGAAKLYILTIHEGIKISNFESCIESYLNEENRASLMHRSLKIAHRNTIESLETRPDGSLVRLTPSQAELFIAAYNEYGQNEPDSDDKQQYLREIKLALNACNAGVQRIHIIDGREEGAVLKELFSNLGVGTMVYTDEYDAVRVLHSKDLPDILRLMEPLMQNGLLVRRNPEQILEKKDDYYVLIIDGSIRACGALHYWGESQSEIAAIATDPNYTDLGLGRKIVGFLIEKAKKLKMSRVFALTTQSQDWFESLGFKEVSVDSLPEQKRSVYDYNRGSKVFALDL